MSKPCRIAATATVVFLLLISGFAAVAADQTLALDVVVNGHPIGKIGEFILRDGALYARPDELRVLGFKVPDSVVATEDNLILISRLPGVTTRLQMATQTLEVKAANASLLPVLLQAGAGARAGPVESGLGATLNYDITGTSVGSQTVSSGAFDLRAFSPWGVVSSTFLGYAGDSPSGIGQNTVIRLDASYAFSDPDTLRRYQVGDFITAGLAWTRPDRLGGVSISSDFALRPDLITFPLPTLTGAVGVPSTVDVLVNGTRLLSRQIQPGPFQIPQLPVVTGAGTIAMTVTDALGRQVTTTVPFYASASLLAAGLQSYSAEVGAIRRNWGLISDDYGDPAASGTYRRGLSNTITLELHAEGSNSLAMGGGGFLVNLGNLAVVNLSGAGSTGSGPGGVQVSAGVQRVGRVFNLGVSAIAASHNFRDITAVNGDPVPRLQVSANAGVSFGRFGSFGLAYTEIDRDAAPLPVSYFAGPGTVLPPTNSSPGGAFSVSNGVVSFLPAQHSKVLSASYTVQVKNASLFATGFHDLADTRSTGVLVGLTIPLGTRSSINVSEGSGSTGGYTQAQAVQSPESVGDWGYQAYGATGNPDHEFAQLQYKSPWGLVSAGVDRIDRQTSLRTEAQGALSFVDGGVFASNMVPDSFAVVDTGGVKGVHVLEENRPAGTTDRSGRLLVPDLRSFDLNHIAIDPTDVPIDATTPFLTREVRPQDRSGVVVRFPIQISHAALLRLIDPAGRPLPLGSVITVQPAGVGAPVGYDGEAYLENLGPDNLAEVEQPNGVRCVVRFTYHAEPGSIPTFGPLRCQAGP